ncbi:protein of unknown function [Nocardioides exalbidus]|uniref:HNH nuclease domain-containing protein n=1 Tax=Nocardioides exalbidus TaxID=402596 RepID=A0A1H4WYS7_9ACTN|nr:HNH endonuclease signature motif containing protein [Nocardioides exalbidus]SEC98467.1 protein of unknown function [Nocardioides exalbidus]
MSPNAADEPVPAWATHELHALADELIHATGSREPVELLDQLDALERIKAAAAAAQVTVTALLAAATEDDEPHHGRRRPCRSASIGAEVGLAVRISPYQGEQRLLLSRRLHDDLPGVHASLARGDINETQALAVARQVAHLDPRQRGLVDTDITGGASGLVGLGDEKIRRRVRRSCLTVAADTETRRYERARADRHVTARQLDDGTGRITAVVPIEHLAAVRARLSQAAATARAAGDERTSSQVRADTLVERITGHDPATPLPVRVNLVISAESLLGDDDEPGDVDGVGWLPASLCTDLVRRASAAARASLRRLFVTPAERHLVALESRSRTFPAGLAELLGLRDGGACRTPGCGAPVRHRDHVVRDSDGGPTSAHNGQGLCERCNYVKETPGWTSWTASPPQGRHEVHGVTEHLRIFRSTSPPMPGGTGTPTPARSPGELHVLRALRLAA